MDCSVMSLGTQHGVDCVCGGLDVFTVLFVSPNKIFHLFHNRVPPCSSVQSPQCVAKHQIFNAGRNNTKQENTT